MYSSLVYSQQDTQVFGTLSTTWLHTDTTALTGTAGDLWNNEVVINAITNVTENITAAGSFAITNRYAHDYSLDIDYASVDYARQISSTANANIRLGRVKYDIGLRDRERNNPASRNTILLPLAVDWPAFASYAQSLDGIQIEAHKISDDYGEFSISSTYGTRNIPRRDVDQIFFGYFHTSLDGDFDLVKPITSTTLKYQNNNVQLQYNQTRLSLHRTFDPTITPRTTYMPLSFDFSHNFDTYGFLYTGDTGGMSIEYVDHKSIYSKPAAVAVDFTKLLYPNMILNAGYSKFYHRNNDNLLPYIPEWGRNSHEYHIGVSTRLNSNLTLKVEYRKGYGTVWFPAPANKPDWDMIGVQLVYSFNIL
jgi:hypothetical protein